MILVLFNKLPISSFLHIFVLVFVNVNDTGVCVEVCLEGQQTERQADTSSMSPADASKLMELVTEPAGDEVSPDVTVEMKAEQVNRCYSTPVNEGQKPLCCFINDRIMAGVITDSQWSD